MRSLQLNADRAPKLKAVVRHLLMTLKTLVSNALTLILLGQLTPFCSGGGESLKRIYKAGQEKKEQTSPRMPK
jgi:hypothetical protein